MNVESLQIAFKSVEELYHERGIFMKKPGFGKKPALLIIDMAYGWTDPSYPSGSARLDEAVQGIQKLLPACRAMGVPIIYTTAPYRHEKQDPSVSHPDLAKKFRDWDARACEIDERLKPHPDELIIFKENASAFFGTHLAPYLIERRVDTVIITGCSTSWCIRATVTDAAAYRFKPIIPRQCVQDRAEAAHAWNLFDIGTKLGDVREAGEVLDYLANWQAPS
jgi:nicotinamidase-related amidase